MAFYSFITLFIVREFILYLFRHYLNKIANMHKDLTITNTEDSLYFNSIRVSLEFFKIKCYSKRLLHC